MGQRGRHARVRDQCQGHRHRPRRPHQQSAIPLHSFAVCSDAEVGKKRGKDNEDIVDNKVYKVVWDILQALRSHDDRFDALINKLDLIGSYHRKMEVIAITDTIAKKSAKVGERTRGEAGKDQRDAFAGELLRLIEDESCDVFFGDEAGFEGDPRPRRKWAKRGQRITQGYFGGHIRQNVIRAIAPKSGQLVSLIVPHCNSDVFQVFLDTMEEEALPVTGRRCVLVLDNASWHKVKSLNWHHIEPAYLPPYSSDFNPIERLWQHLKSDHLADFITKNGEELTEKLIDSIQSLMREPEVLRSVCRTHSE